MRKRVFKILIIGLLVFFIFMSPYIIRGMAAAEDVEPEYGNAPKVDGSISKKSLEWNNATKFGMSLLPNETNGDKGIPVDIWVMQNETNPNNAELYDANLYISVQFELETHSPNEFVGILISEDDHEGDDDFVDAKIVQFSGLGGGSPKFEYYDYHIINKEYIKDSDSAGDGAAELDENLITYEFEIPVNSSESDDDDVFLDFGEQYAFKIVYGDEFSYPDGIEKSNVILINIEYPESNPPRPIWLDIHNILCGIIFGTLAGLGGFYTYKIVVLKKKVNRLIEKT